MDDLKDKNNIEDNKDIENSEDMKNISENESNIKEKICGNCGANLEDDQAFCPKCGQEVGIQTKEEKNITGSKKNKKIIYGIITIAAAIVIFFLIRGVQAKEIVLNKEEVIIKVGESEELTYTINPENTKNKEVTWETSNDTISKVNYGIITGVNEGTCTISVITSNNKTDTCFVTVEPAGPDFSEIYIKYCQDSWADLASDNSFISIDTNPDDIEDYFNFDAMEAIEKVNKALGFPDVVMENMYNTNSLDGKQTEEGDGVKVSWKYHPDNGMEVIYSIVD
jgi:uncharacterized protein YjdB